MGKVLDLARTHARRFVNSGGFEVDIQLTPQNPPGVPVTIKGLASKHWHTIQTEALSVDSKNTHITVAEADLVAASYPIRQNDEVSMEGHLVEFTDSAGILRNHTIIQQYPDETLGLLVFILDDFE